MKYFVQVGGTEFEVDIDADGVRVDGDPVSATLEPLPGTPLRQLRIGSRTTVFSVESAGGGAWVLGSCGERWAGGARRADRDEPDEHAPAWARASAGGACAGNGGE